jgi:mRNA deadenylase 3'-5' endonuclease subunit Ccr4
MKMFLKIFSIVLLCILVIAICYVIYVFVGYKRIADNTEISATNVSNLTLETDKEYSILTYNIGYGSYPQDYTFFMEGGKESIARSYNDVMQNINGSVSLIKQYNPDIILLQEVDIKGDRSYKINEFEQFRNSFNEYNSLYAINYDTSYLLYPLTHPVGKNTSSIALFSKFLINSTTRRSLPISNGFSKFFDLDRCYTVSEIDISNGKKLYLYNVHLTAYGGSDDIRKEQTKMISNDMNEKIKKRRLCNLWWRL